MVLSRQVELPGGSEIAVIPRVEWADLLDPRPIPLAVRLLGIKCQAGVEVRLIKFQSFPRPLPRLGVRFGAMRRRIAALPALTTKMA